MPSAPPKVSGVVIEHSKFDSLDKLPLHQQAIQIIGMFKGTKNLTEYSEISIRWSKIRPRLIEYESQQQCKDAANGDWDIALGMIDDVVKAPIGVIISVGELVVSLMEHEDDDASKELKKAWEDIKSEGYDQLKDKAADKIDEKTKRMRTQALDRLREALLRYLQSVSKRSRAHFLKIIGNIVGVLAAGFKLSTMVITGVLTPSKIAPEWCGLINIVDEAQADASARVLPSFRRGNIMSGLSTSTAVRTRRP